MADIGRMIYQENDLLLYTNIHYENVGHMGLCDLSLASPVLAAILDKGFQKVSAREQLAQINEDCLNWIRNLK